MKEFEIVSNGGVMVDHIRVPLELAPAVESLFDGRVFDMDTAATVLPAIDSAKLSLQSDPDKYRDLITSRDGLGLRQVRSMLDSMRDLLVTFPDATVSGLFEA